MKTLLALACLLTLTGCGTLSGDLRKGIPEGSWREVDATVTGKFSSTKIVATDVVKDGKNLTAKELHVRHSNIWVPLIELNAIGFEPEAKKEKVSIIKP